MLRTFAAGLIATALIAAPAFAQTGGNNAANPAAPTMQTMPKAPAVATAKPAVTAKHALKKTHRHASRTGKMHAMHQARHVKSHKAHAVHQAKQHKTGKTHQAKRVKSGTAS